jgi:hypothetical protein
MAELFASFWGPAIQEKPGESPFIFKVAQIKGLIGSFPSIQNFSQAVSGFSPVTQIPAETGCWHSNGSTRKKAAPS